MERLKPIAYAHIQETDTWFNIDVEVIDGAVLHVVHTPVPLYSADQLAAAREEGRREGIKQMREAAAQRVLSLRSNSKWHTKNTDYIAGAKDGWNSASLAIRAIPAPPQLQEPEA